MIPKPILDPTITFGNVLQTLTIMAGLGYFLVSQTQWRTDVDAQLKTAAESRAQLAKDKIENDKERDSIARNDSLQDERIGLINRTLLDIQATQRATNETLNKISTSIAVIEVRTAKDAN